MTDEEKAKLLDWVSDCQSAYRIENTPGQLQESRAALVEYVEGLIAAAVAKAASGPQDFDREWMNR